MKNLKNSWLALFILVLLLSVYCLTYSGTFITDDEHILASRSLSLAFDGNFNDNRVYGNSRVFALGSLPGEQSEQALNIEPGQEVVGALLARLSILLQAGRVQTLFLLNIWVTALTGMVLFYIVIGLGYSASTAIILALLFGLGTIAWPFSKTYFRDSLAMLFLTLSWGSLQIILHPKEDLNRKYIRTAWAVLPIALIAGILTKNTVTLAVPILLLDLLINHKTLFSKNKPANPRSRSTWRKVFLIGIIPVVLGIFWLFLKVIQPVLARFTPEYYTFVLNFFIHTPHPNFWEALAGPLVSPGKSIFIYSPVLILSLIALFRPTRKSWSAWGYLFILIVAQALFYDKDWWGHINWGLRFTLPAIPVLMLASAPVIDRWKKSAQGRTGLWIITGISFLIQLVGILPPMLQYYVESANAIPAISDTSMLWDFKFSPLAWHLKWFLRGEPLDLAAIRMGLQSLPLMISLGAVVVLAILGLKLVKKAWFFPVLFALSAMMTFMLPIQYRDDPVYQSQRTDLQTSQGYITENYKSGDMILVKSYGTPAWDYWMNWTGPSLSWTSLPFRFPLPDVVAQYSTTHEPEIAMDEITLALFRKIPGTNQRVWLVLPVDSPGGDLDIEADWLRQHGSLDGLSTFTGSDTQTRVFLFTIP